MHIAFLTPEYPHPDFNRSGGLGTSIKNLAASLVEAGETVTVFVYSQAQDKQFEDQGIHIHSIAKRKYKFAGWYLHRKFLQRYINRVILLHKIDVLEAPDWTGITALMRFKCPLVIRCNGSDGYFCHLDNRKQKPKNRWFEHRALKNADHILAVSAFTGKLTKEIFELNKEIQVIPNSIDVEQFRPMEAPQIPNRILYYGSIIRKKGVLELAKICNFIFEQNPDARLILAGNDVNDVFTGRSTQELFMESVRPEFRKHIKFKGLLAYEGVQEEIAKAAVIVLPSFAEALPMTWIEAMAMEKALVTSDIGWANEVMRDGETGYTVDPKNHKYYADAVLKLLDSKDLRSQMGGNARKRVIEKFATAIVVKQNLEFYKSVLKA
ncbi:MULTISPECIES: glycosyltransferase family 4 protein [unclassified Leeuwenhoekiella]|uniref:glycosyltransferase family 4 protein n=1 Tax=unclassified Leeuwenhoekiella TaxID=2615029 RepID=UPI000C591036|nr:MULTISPECIES: glycosyltransferase family 4 protein [unclassified Leeuwenhoekiella]MAW96675.1 glycosyl transferase [Leeuwenhoekiella sp.]MBA81564.1 glycosyl transferase [Leeuwenhoekiella sp.]|tara:strand:- start:88984 stop:90123 length:1140 start_codon:yes stop_codon:yes gene_type:complete